MARKPNYGKLYTLRADGRYMGYWHDAQGKRHAIYDRDPEELHRKVQERENAAAQPALFKELAQDWERAHMERISFKTSESYAAPLRRLLDVYGDKAASEISAQSVHAFLCRLGAQGYSRRSVQMHRDILNMIFNNAIVSGKAANNPVAAVSMPHNLAVTRRELPDDNAIDAVKRSVGVPFGLFALVCLYAGLRRGEALALKYEDIDRVHGVIHVSKAVEFVGNNPHLKSTKTKAGKRVVPLLYVLADAIPIGTGFIFHRGDGGLLTKTQYRKRWSAYCKDIGYNITAHQLRHGYATLLYEAGIPDKDAQELLGHSSITVTRDVYTHIRRSRRAETADRLNQFVSKAEAKKDD